MPEGLSDALMAAMTEERLGSSGARASLRWTSTACQQPRDDQGPPSLPSCLRLCHQSRPQLGCCTG